MKYVPYVSAVAGFLLIMSVADDAMSYTQMLVQSLIGIAMLGMGVFMITDRKA